MNCSRSVWCAACAFWLGLVAVAAAGEEAAPAAESQTTPDVVYVATPHDVVAKMLELAEVRREDLVYDLGCGDGRIIVTAAREFGCRGVGFDINPRRVQEARQTAATCGVQDRVTIEQRDIFELDLAPASVITLYLLPRLNVRLIPQLEQLRPGARIVSHDYGMKGVTPERVVKIVSREDGVSHTIYLWKTPLEIDAASDSP